VTLFELPSVTQCHENYKKLDILSLAVQTALSFLLGWRGEGGGGGGGVLLTKVPKVRRRRHFSSF
jgi:hypothetical protein